VFNVIKFFLYKLFFLRIFYYCIVHIICCYQLWWNKGFQILKRFTCGDEYRLSALNCACRCATAVQRACWRSTPTVVDTASRWPFWRSSQTGSFRSATSESFQRLNCGPGGQLRERSELPPAFLDRARSRRVFLWHSGRPSDDRPTSLFRPLAA